MKIKVNITGHPAHIEEALKKFATQAEKEKELDSSYRERKISRNVIIHSHKIITPILSQKKE